MERKTKKLTRKTAKGYERDFKKVRDAVLSEGEEARQMINHNPMYWITDKARVISCGGRKGLTLLKQIPRGGRKNTKESADWDYNEKNCVMLRIDGKSKLCFIHNLISEYFPDKIAYEYLTGKGDKVTHHIDGYDVNDPYESNKPEHLEKLDDKRLHGFIHQTLNEPTTVSDALKKMRTFASMTKDDAVGTVMECPNSKGKGGKVYEIFEPVEIDEDNILSQEMADKFSRVFLKQGQTLVQLVWYKGDAKDLDAIVKDYKVIEREELKATAPRKKISIPKKAKDGGAIETA